MEDFNGGCLLTSIGFGAIGLLGCIGSLFFSKSPQMLLDVGWFYLLLILIPGLIIYSFNESEKKMRLEQIKEEAIKKKKEDVERERRRKEAYEREMMNLVAYSNKQVSTIRRLYEEMLNTIPVADIALDKAEEEFNGSFYSPFWDQIEISTNQLASYYHNLKGINYFMDIYWENVKKLDEQYKSKLEPCVLPGRLPDPDATTKRLARVIRNTQDNFEFTVIYGQRKTNKFLYDGFKNLGEAIYSVGDHITDSLNDLAHNLDSSLNDIIRSTSENSRIISDNIQEQTRRVDEHAEQQRRYESDSLRNQSDQQKTLEQQKRVLDSQNRRINNIQRGRKPGLLDE
jgi:hypothetical protein